MSKIQDEDHLLRLYYEAERRVLYERSGSIEEDVRSLNVRVLEYAARKGMDYPGYVEAA